MRLRATWTKAVQKLRRRVRLLALLGLAAALVVVVALALDPRSDWAMYYFSSFFQGFAALLGIALTGGFISFQLSAEQYGSIVAGKRLTGNPFLRNCLAALVAVLLMAALGLGVGPLAGPSADSRIQSFGQYLVRALAGLVLAASFTAGYLTWRALASFAEALIPSRVMGHLANELIACDRKPYAETEKATQNIVHVFETLWGREALFTDGWQGYLGAMRQVLSDKDRNDHWKFCFQLGGPIRRLIHTKAPTSGMVNTMMSLVHEALSLKSPGALSLATVLDDCLPRDVLTAALDLHFGSLLESVSHGNPPDKGEMQLTIAGQLYFWYRQGEYPSLRAGLAGRPSRRVYELMHRLPSDPSDEPQFLAALSEALGLSKEQELQIAEEYEELVQWGLR